MKILTPHFLLRRWGVFCFCLDCVFKVGSWEDALKKEEENVKFPSGLSKAFLVESYLHLTHNGMVVAVLECAIFKRGALVNILQL